MNDESIFHLFSVIDTIHPTTRKINDFKKLKKGWNFGEGVSFKKSILMDAVFLNQEAGRLGFFETDAFPGPNGEVMVTVYSGNHYLEFIIELDRSVTFRHEQAGEELYRQEALSLHEAESKIKEFHKQWSGYESSIENITTGVYSDSLHWAFDQQATTGFPLFNLNASMKAGQRSASMLQSTTQETQKKHRPFGYSQTQLHYYPIAS